MIIRGNTVGTTMPRTNYNQTDETKPDYLVGKEALDQKIADAKKAGTDAAIVAGKALDKAGGTMTGSINMGANAITNVKEPTNDNDAANKSYVDSKIPTLEELTNSVLDKFDRWEGGSY
jgi:hypothetical protein